MVSLLILATLFFAAYWLGWIPVSAKRAVMFAGRVTEASFTSCHGRIYRIIRFRESRSYSFRLDSRISAGELTVELSDHHHNPILTLSPSSPTGVCTVQKNARCYLTVRFANASGSYQLDWT